MLADEHDATSQPVEPVARQWIPAIATICPHNLDDGVEVVSTSRMYGHARRLVDDNHVVILVDDTDGLRGTRGLVAVESVGYDVAVLDYCFDARHRLAIEDDAALFYGFLVVLGGPVAELAREDVENFPSPPSFLAEGVVCEVVGRHLAQAIFEVVWRWPGVAGRDCDGWRLFPGKFVVGQGRVFVARG